MIKLTNLGKRIYGDKKLVLDGRGIGYYVEPSLPGYAAYIKLIAENPLEIKALLDMGLIGFI